MKHLLIALIVTLAAAAAPASSAERVVNIFNWSDYIDPSVLEDFTRETGMKVIYDTYDSNEMLEARLLAGDTGYDIVVPSATFLQRPIARLLMRRVMREGRMSAPPLMDGNGIRTAATPCISAISIETPTRRSTSMG
jgi:putrescine transport system substrate-binding protein